MTDTKERFQLHELSESVRHFVLLGRCGLSHRMRCTLNEYSSLSKADIVQVEHRLDDPVRNTIPDTPLFLALDTASKVLGKNASMFVYDYQLTRAGPESANPGHVYIRHRGSYVGKVLGRKFTLNTEDFNRAELLSIIDNPRAAALDSGRRTGKCAGCGKPLAEGVYIGEPCLRRFAWD